jgi:hypothetical protein
VFGARHSDLLGGANHDLFSVEDPWNLTQALEGSNFVETVGPLIQPIDLTKEAFEFNDFIFADVVPHLVDRKVGP